MWRVISVVIVTVVMVLAYPALPVFAVPTLMYGDKDGPSISAGNAVVGSSWFGNCEPNGLTFVVSGDEAYWRIADNEATGYCTSVRVTEVATPSLTQYATKIAVSGYYFSSGFINNPGNSIDFWVGPSYQPYPWDGTNAVHDVNGKIQRFHVAVKTNSSDTNQDTENYKYLSPGTTGWVPFHYEMNLVGAANEESYDVSLQVHSDTAGDAPGGQIVGFSRVAIRVEWSNGYVWDTGYDPDGTGSPPGGGLTPIPGGPDNPGDNPPADVNGGLMIRGRIGVKRSPAWDLIRWREGIIPVELRGVVYKDWLGSAIQTTSVPWNWDFIDVNNDVISKPGRFSVMNLSTDNDGDLSDNILTDFAVIGFTQGVVPGGMRLSVDCFANRCAPLANGRYMGTFHFATGFYDAHVVDFTVYLWLRQLDTDNDEVPDGPTYEEPNCGEVRIMPQGGYAAGDCPQDINLRIEVVVDSKWDEIADMMIGILAMFNELGTLVVAAAAAMGRLTGFVTGISAIGAGNAPGWTPGLLPDAGIAVIFAHMLTYQVFPGGVTVGSLRDWLMAFGTGWAVWRLLQRTVK